jgi:peptidoglycan/LPS O-acetylase OafA/YrhL
MKTDSYRPDIDGVRAIAVLVVVLYHAQFAAFSGGYVGVDVFFVISGFLITRLVRDEIRAGTFSFARFYERRARRLFPAMFFTFLVSSGGAYLVLTPEYLRNFGGSLLYSALSLSNVFFWLETGYFDLAAHTKPLLHMWSLSVEEQFYLFWPALLVFSVKKYDRLVPYGIVIAGVVNLLATIALRQHPAAIFYLTPFRIVEFCIGGVMVWLVALQPRNKLMLEPLVPIGLGLVLYAVFTYDEKTVFPGLAVLPPCLGTALLIYAGTARYAGLVLRNPLSVWLGLISYSVYLIHWPIIVFFGQLSMGSLPETAKYGIVIASIAVAALMYRYVETPFRRPAPERRLSAPAFGLGCCMLVLALSLPASSMWANNGWEWRYPEKIREQMKLILDKEYAWKELNHLNTQFSSERNVKVLLIGDSQAGDFLNMIVTSGHKFGVEIKTDVIQGECQAVIPRDASYYAALKPPYDQYCRQYHDRLRNSGKIERADIAVLASAWQPFGVAELNNTVDYLLGHGVKEVYVVGRKDQGYNGQTLLQRYWKALDINAISARFRSQEAVNINAMILAAKTRAHYIDLMSNFCPSSRECLVLTPDNDIMFSDIMHLTRPATEFMAKRLLANGIFAFLEHAAQLPPRSGSTASR